MKDKKLLALLNNPIFIEKPYYMRKSLPPLAIYFLFFVIPFIGFSQIDIDKIATNITIECDDNIDNYLASNGYAVASSNCGSLIWTHDFVDFEFYCNDTAVITFTVTDECDNTETTTGTVYIRDTTPPVFTRPASDLTVTCDGAGNTAELNAWLSSNGGADAFDNCGIVAWSNDFLPLNSDCNETVSTTVNFLITDECGNTEITFATFTIEPPTSVCPTTNITLSSQADVNAFSTNYPDCSEIMFGLTISGADITDLSPLSAITSVIGSFPTFSGLIIKDNPLLTNLDGLENISVMQFANLVIENNSLLTNILGLSGLSGAVGDSIIIKDNPLLQSLQGLNNITNPQSDDLYITNNDSLTNLEGLGSLTWADDVYIRDNDGLINFNGLNAFEISGDFHIQNNSSLESFDGLTTSLYKVYDLLIDNNILLQDITSLNDVIIDTNLFITNNPLLSTCSINPICYLLSEWDSVNNPSAVVIDNNASGCMNIDEIESVCSSLIPVNDECEGAQGLSFGVPSIVNNNYSTISSYFPSCNIDSQFRADVWFSFNTGALTMIDILVDNGYSLQLWQGTCGSLTQVAEACGASALNDISVTVSTDYFIQVWFNNSRTQAKMANKKTAKQASDFEIVIKESLNLSAEQDLYLEFSMYPNPVKEELIIKNTQNSTIENILVYSVLGKKLIETNRLNINFSGIPSGIYFVKIKTDRGQLTKKVIKQ